MPDVDRASARGGQAPALRFRGIRFTVGRGPVPRHAAGARFPERLRGTGPRATKQQWLLLPVGRGPVPRHAPNVTTSRTMEAYQFISVAPARQIQTTDGEN